MAVGCIPLTRVVVGQRRVKHVGQQPLLQIVVLAGVVSSHPQLEIVKVIGLRSHLPVHGVHLQPPSHVGSVEEHLRAVALHDERGLAVGVVGDLTISHHILLYMVF